MCKDTYDLTVVVPIYNTEKYLKRCIDSLVNQTEKNIEIILVDDGSRDQSGSICDDYSDRYQNITVIHKKNEGQGLARNDGLRVAKGRFISFLDSDDYYEEGACKKLINVMDKSGADICSYGYQIDDKNGRLLVRPSVNNRVYNKENFVLHYFGDSYDDEELRGVSSCMSVFRSDIIKDNHIEFPSERVVASEDTAFCLEYCKYINKAITISDPLYHYCQNENSFSQGFRSDRLKLMKAHIMMLERYAVEYGNYQQVKRRIAMTAWINLIAYCKQQYRHLKFKDAIQNIRSAVEDESIKNKLEILTYKQLPFQQRFYYKLVMARQYIIIYVLVAFRSSIKL